MKKFYLALGVLIAFAFSAHAQSVYQPYSYDFYQKLNRSLYSTKSREHTAMKPILVDDSVLRRPYDSLMNVGVDTSRKHSWVYRKLFNEHLIDVRDKEYTFYVDYLPDLVIGKDLADKRSVHMNTRGYQIGGTIGSKFYFYSSGFENQSVFPAYENAYINRTGIVPGQAYDRGFGLKNGKDYSYVTALISYTPVKYLNIAVGNDKNFIGDGYRSLLLSDYASPYPFLKLTLNLGNVHYMAMWAQMNDPTAPKFSYLNGDRKKWATFHYLDWNVSNRFSVGFFDAIIWADKDNNGVSRGFDFNYANPIIFLRPVEASIGSPDNALIGFTSKYKISDGATVYGQFALDEFEAKNFFSNSGSYRNKYGFQLGVRGADLFNVKNLNYLAEFNSVKPYTYSETSEIINYSEQNEPLGHPWGANFREALAILSYSYKKFDFRGQLDYGRYGLDKDSLNYGKDIFKNYGAPAKDKGNYIGQGLTTNLYYLEGTASYLINPKYNLRIELGALYRREVNALGRNETKMITIGLRSTFRNLYHDF